MSTPEPQDEIILGHDYLDDLRRTRTHRFRRLWQVLGVAVGIKLVVMGLIAASGGGSWLGLLQSLAATAALGVVVATVAMVAKRPSEGPFDVDAMIAEREEKDARRKH